MPALGVTTALGRRRGAQRGVGGGGPGGEPGRSAAPPSPGGEMVPPGGGGGGGGRGCAGLPRGAAAAAGRGAGRGRRRSGVLLLLLALNLAAVASAGCGRALRLWRSVLCPCGARGSVNPRALSRSALCKARLCGRLCRTVVPSQPVAVNIYNRCLSGALNHPQRSRCHLARQKREGSGFKRMASVFPAKQLVARFHVEKKRPRVGRQQQPGRGVRARTREC